MSLTFGSEINVFFKKKHCRCELEFSERQIPIQVAKKFGHMEIAQMLESGVSPYDNVQFRRADSKSWQQDYSTVRKTHLGAELWRPVAGPN